MSGFPTIYIAIEQRNNSFFYSLFWLKEIIMTILVNSQMLHDFNNKKIIHNKYQITLFEKILCAICAYHHLSCEFDSGTLTTFYDQVCQGCLRIVVFFLRSLSSVQSYPCLWIVHS